MGERKEVKKLMTEEERAVGGIDARTWRRYLSVAGILQMLLPTLLAVLAQLSRVATSAWLAWWCADDGAIARSLGQFVAGYDGGHFDIAIRRGSLMISARFTHMASAR